MDTDSADFDRAMREELNRRVGAFANDSQAEAAFGQLGAIDAVFIVVLCVALPALLIWMFR